MANVCGVPGTPGCPLCTFCILAHLILKKIYGMSTARRPIQRLGKPRYGAVRESGHGRGWTGTRVSGGRISAGNKDAVTPVWHDSHGGFQPRGAI